MVYSLHTNETCSFNYVEENCHARSIMVKRICPYKTVIDRMCDTTEKFNYFNTTGGLVINREVDRMLNGLKTFKDDCWLAFTFFMTLFSQIFTPSNELFSNEFISMIERNPCMKENVSYEKKFDVCSDGNVRSTISYVTSRFDRVSHTDDDGRTHHVYDSVLDLFGIGFSSNSNGYYPKSSKKVLFEEHAVYSKRVCKETYENRGFKHLYERHHSCSGKSSCKFFNGMVSYVKEVKVVNIQLIIRKMTCFNWKMKKCHVTIRLWII